MKLKNALTLIMEGPHDKNKKKAIFLSGMPGSGKTEFYKKVLDDKNLKRLDTDIIYSYLVKKSESDDIKDPKNYDKYGKEVGEKLKSLNRLYTKNELGLVIDSTGGNSSKILKIKNDLEAKGYDTCMVFIKTPVKSSFDRIKKRERGVDKDYAKNIYKKLNKNVELYKSAFNKFWEVNNEKDYLSLEGPIQNFLRS